MKSDKPLDPFHLATLYLWRGLTVEAIEMLSSVVKVHRWRHGQDRPSRRPPLEAQTKLIEESPAVRPLIICMSHGFDGCAWPFLRISTL